MSDIDVMSITREPTQLGRMQAEHVYFNSHYSVKADAKGPFMEEKKDIDYAALGKRIKKARKRLGWTQADLAQKVQIATTNMSSIECARKKISLGRIVQIANTLGIGVDELLCDSLTTREGLYGKKVDTMFKDLSRDEREYAIRLLEYTVSSMKGYSIQRKNVSKYSQNPDFAYIYSRLLCRIAHFSGILQYL